MAFSELKRDGLASGRFRAESDTIPKVAGAVSVAVITDNYPAMRPSAA